MKQKRPVTFSDFKKRAMRSPELRRAMERPDDDPFLEVAYRLITLRRRRGWSQADLAKRMHISQQAVARLESLNYKGHSLNSLRKVAQVYGKKLRVSFVGAGK